MAKSRSSRVPEALWVRADMLSAQHPAWNPKELLRLLLVETGLYLQEALGFADEPITALWVLLSGAPVREIRLQNLTAEQRRMLASARSYLQYPSKNAWTHALRDYFGFPAFLRNHDLTDPSLEKALLKTTIRNRHPANRTACQAALASIPQIPETSFTRIKPDRWYAFKVPGTDAQLHVEFSAQDLQNVDLSRHRLQLQRPRTRTAFKFSLEELKSTAEFLDQREYQLRFQWGNAIETGSWVSRLAKLDYRKVGPDRGVSEEKSDIEIAGFTHVAGMVASGKSTLAHLLIMHLLHNNTDARVTLVVQTTAQAISLANTINTWMGLDPESDSPVAVPLVGRSSREKHLRKFLGSREYKLHLESKKPHWGERWLATSCPLQGLAREQKQTTREELFPLKVGQEPCEKLIPERTQDPEGHARLCPFFHRCPSQQVFHDLPDARIWITTAGAMVLGRLPSQMQERKVHFGEAIYRLSDLVIFDEADSVMQWMDQVFAEVIPLTRNGQGIFDRILFPSAEFQRDNRVTDTTTMRWIKAASDTQHVIGAALSLMQNTVHSQMLRRWVDRGYFTPQVLFYRIARRMAGLGDYPTEKEAETEEKRADTVTALMDFFDRLLDLENPLRATDLQPDLQMLYTLLQQINTIGDSAVDPDVQNGCLVWMKTVNPELEMLLEERANRMSPPKSGLGIFAFTAEEGKREPVDSPETLAARLQFTLTVLLLDRHVKSVFHEWMNRVPTIEESEPGSRIAEVIEMLLPVPLTGKMFGTYYAQSENNHALSMLAYKNVGRCYMLNFHRLFEDLDSEPGPHVLAMSGTSYLPDSTSFHVGEPQALLAPDARAVEAITESEFMFAPCYAQDGEPIRLSGAPQQELLDRLSQQIRAMCRHQKHRLKNELALLKQKGEEDPEKWADRRRIFMLVNTYEQAEFAARELQSAWPEYREFVCFLSSKEERAANGLSSSDVEQFAASKGIILIAPLQAVGRGFNILNDRGKAAFGSVFFLTRPYPHPQDASRIAQELNRRMLDWLEDPDWGGWQADGLLNRARSARRHARHYWRLAEQRSYYSTLYDLPEHGAKPRRDLAATTLGTVVQAVGRVLRGGVPFRAVFVDAAWSPKRAKGARTESGQSSLLTEMIDVMSEYASQDEIGKSLYDAIASAMVDIKYEVFTPQEDAE